MAEAPFQMETDLRLESSLWIGNKRYRAVLTGWHFNWTEVDKKNRDKKTSRWRPYVQHISASVISCYIQHMVLNLHHVITLYCSSLHLFAWFKMTNSTNKCMHTQENTFWHTLSRCCCVKTVDSKTVLYSKVTLETR